MPPDAVSQAQRTRHSQASWDLTFGRNPLTMLRVYVA